MEAFKLTLPNGAPLTGIANIPSRSSVPGTPYRPLLIGIHGGTYKSTYFDVNETISAKPTSDSLAIPFVAFDRPDYGGTGSVLPIPEGSSFFNEWGLWLHRYILPTLWDKFGKPSDCTAMVLLCHSLGAPGAIVAAAMHADEEQATGKAPYPLAGLIMSGWGSIPMDTSPPNQATDPPPPPKADEKEVFPPAARQRLIPPGTADPALYEHADRLGQPMPVVERAHIATKWLPEWRERWAAKVRVPLMYALAEREALWPSSREHVADFTAAFPAARRVDATFLRGAPHNIEQSYWGPGWYARCFGFAMEVVADAGVGSLEWDEGLDALQTYRANK